MDSIFVLVTGSMLCDCILRTDLVKIIKKQCDINGLNVLMIHINEKKKKKKKRCLRYLNK